MRNIVQFLDVLRIILPCLSLICISHYIHLLLVKRAMYLKSRFVLKRWTNSLKEGLHLIGVIKKVRTDKFQFVAHPA